MISGDKILVIAPHTDDGEFGCGGSIVKFINQGKEVHLAAFSSCRISVPKGFPDDVLVTEIKKATKVLGIPPENLYLYEFPVRRFDHYRQDILEELVKLQKTIDPDLVFLPSEHDLHQDHHIVALEGIRAFKRTSILAYEMPWNNISFSTQAFIHLSDSEMEVKIEALKEYKSQYKRPYASEEFLRGLAVTRGTSAGVKYAEAFEVVRLIIR